MTSFQTSALRQAVRSASKWRPLSSFSVLALSAVGVLLPFLSAVAEGERLGNSLPETPLILKDGRIARVSIHTIPFPRETAALATTTAVELKAFMQTMATDCFLTAQVIGHVDKVETNGRDTVDIHRLARARADTIQESLVTSGLPAASVASVWDWQFMVQDARATLWVFRLVAGDDCEDKTLSTARNDQVAALEKAAAQQNTGQQSAEPLVAESQPVQQRVIAAAKTAAPALAKPMPTSVSKPGSTAGDGQAAKQALAPAPKTPGPIELTAATAPGPNDSKKGRVTIADGGALEITFASNSSYFPQGWGEPLREFLDQVVEGESYIVRVQTSVDNAASVAGASSEDEAIKYNQWLAERRFERVKSWLLKNTDSSTLKIEPEIVNDGSRRVTVKMNPLG